MPRKRRPPAERVLEPGWLIPLKFRLEGADAKRARYKGEFSQDVERRITDLACRATKICNDPSCGKELRAIAAMISGEIHGLECADDEIQIIRHAYNLGILAERLRFFDEWIAQNWLTVTQAKDKLNQALTIPITKVAVSKACTKGRLRTNGEKGHARRIDPQSLASFVSSREE